MILFKKKEETALKLHRTDKKHYTEIALHTQGQKFIKQS